MQINFEKLAYGLGVPVVGISALKQRGLTKMIEAAKHVANTQPLPPRYDARLEAGLTEIMAILPETIPQQQNAGLP